MNEISDPEFLSLLWKPDDNKCLHLGDHLQMWKLMKADRKRIMSHTGHQADAKNWWAILRHGEENPSFEMYHGPEKEIFCVLRQLFMFIIEYAAVPVLAFAFWIFLTVVKKNSSLLYMIHSHISTHTHTPHSFPLPSPTHTHASPPLPSP